MLCNDQSICLKPLDGSSCSAVSIWRGGSAWMFRGAATVITVEVQVNLIKSLFTPFRKFYRP